MPSVGHIAVGLAAARFGRPPMRASAWATLLVVAAGLPDLDLVAFSLGIPYHAPFGHRGASHSFVFAALCGMLIALAVRARPVSAARVGLIVGAMVATHGLLDTLTDGGLMLEECGLFLPFFVVGLWPRAGATAATSEDR
jgi:inner membrane protein